MIIPCVTARSSSLSPIKKKDRPSACLGRAHRAWRMPWGRRVWVSSISTPTMSTSRQVMCLGSAPRMPLYRVMDADRSCRWMFRRWLTELGRSEVNQATAGHGPAQLRLRLAQRRHAAQQFGRALSGIESASYVANAHTTEETVALSDLSAAVRWIPAFICQILGERR